MSQNQKTGIESTAGTIIGGLVVGFLATQALDWVSTAIYQKEDDKTYEEENAARGYHHAYENQIKQMSEVTGANLSEQQINEYGWKFHRVFGTVSGIQYMMLRKKFPKIGFGFGAFFGLGFFLIVDEFLMAAMKLTPGPAKFSWKVHARGLAAHMAYGVVAEMTARFLDFVVPKSAQISDYARNSSLYEGHLGDQRMTGRDAFDTDAAMSHS